nr:MAG TPA: hypothetical protein [Caudoviricetes sp.]
MTARKDGRQKRKAPRGTWGRGEARGLQQKK